MRCAWAALHPTRDMNFIANTVSGFVLAASVLRPFGKTN